MRKPSEALIQAVQTGDIDQVRQLLKKKPDLNAPDSHGVLLLYWAIQEREHEVARLLLEAGADPNKVTESNTPLMLASAENDLDGMRLLLEFGADVNILTNAGTALTLVCAYGAAVEAATLLIEAGADVNAQDNGITPLLFAVQAESLPLVRLLLENGADPTIADGEDLTPAESARQQKEQAIARFDEMLTLLNP